jgi:hypothetical protein
MVEGHHGKRGGGEHQRIAGLTNGLTTGQEKKIPPRGAIKYRHSRHASLWRLIRVGGITEAVNQPPNFLCCRVIRRGGSRVGEGDARPEIREGKAIPSGP